MGPIKQKSFVVKWVIVVFTVAGAVFLIGCLATRSLGSKQVQAPSRAEIASLTHSILNDSNAKNDIAASFEEKGFLITERQNGELWASKEFQSTFPTSLVYDIFIEKVDGKYQCREIRSSGIGL